jgi:hypothetical protein
LQATLKYTTLITLPNNSVIKNVFIVLDISNINDIRDFYSMNPCKAFLVSIAPQSSTAQECDATGDAMELFSPAPAFTKVSAGRHKNLCTQSAIKNPQTAIPLSLQTNILYAESWCFWRWTLR